MYYMYILFTPLHIHVHVYKINVHKPSLYTYMYKLPKTYIYTNPILHTYMWTFLWQNVGSDWQNHGSNDYHLLESVHVKLKCTETDICYCSNHFFNICGKLEMYYMLWYCDLKFYQCLYPIACTCKQSTLSMSFLDILRW